MTTLSDHHSTEDDRAARLRALLQPLVDAGWVLHGPWSEESGEFGDSVSFELRRDERRIQAELYADDDLAFWTVDPDRDGDADDDPDVVWGDAHADRDALRDWYVEVGLLP